MHLTEIVEKYLAIAGGFAFLAPLANFGLDRAEVERIFGALDEDYHISRYLHFSQVSGAAYSINGFDQTHISIDAENPIRPVGFAHFSQQLFGYDRVEQASESV